MMRLVVAQWPRRVARPRPAASGSAAAELAAGGPQAGRGSGLTGEELAGGGVKRPVSRFGRVVVFPAERDGAEPPVRGPRPVARDARAAPGGLARPAARETAVVPGDVAHPVEPDAGGAPGHVAHPLGRLLGRRVLDRAHGALPDGRPL
jgi:hypothetical protein